MKKILIDKISDEVPQELKHSIAGADTYDSSSSPEAHVYLIGRDGGYYLKCVETGMLEKEVKITQYFHSKNLGVEVLNYSSNDHDWLLAKVVVGKDCADNEYLINPRRLYDTITTELRRLHEIDYSDRPVMNRMTEYLAKAENNHRTGNYGRSSFSDSLGYRSAEQAYEVLSAGKDALQSKVLLHGDYCSPNIILDNWELSGFIDLDCAGAGDRHIDLFWGVRILWPNLKINQYRDRFLDAYGRDKVDGELIKVVAAVRAFG